MMHARVLSNGQLKDGGRREASYPDDVPIRRLWHPGEIVTVCGDDCKAEHPGGARCVIPHVAMIAAREAERAIAALDALCSARFSKLQRRAALMRAGVTGARITGVDAEVAALDNEIKEKING